jgi:hypothetical protein
MFVHQDERFIYTLAIGHKEQNKQKPLIAAWFTLIKGDPLKGQGTANFGEVRTWQDCRDFVEYFDRFDENREAVKTFLRFVDKRAESKN